jgi:hypothetical protein
MTPDAEERVRELFGTVDPPPSRMMATDLLAAGRLARRRRRQWAVTGAACLATIGAGAAGTAVSLAGDAPAPVGPPPADAPAAPCVLERLPLPSGATAGGVNTGSPSGRYLAGYATSKTDAGTPVRWDGAKAQAIRVSGIGEAQGVNDQGTVVGEGQGAGGRMFAWAYAGGKLVELPLPAGWTGAEATGVNAAGQVSGVVFAGERTAAAIWHGTTATARVEVLDAPGDAMAFGISDTGVVVGGLRSRDVAYRWDAKGRGQALPAPGGTEVGDLLGVRGEWAYGFAGGLVEVTRSGGPDGPVTSSTNRKAGLWHLATGRLTVLDDGEFGAVNAAGQAVVNPVGPGVARIRNADGSERTLPGKAGHAYALSADGTRAAGTSGDRPARWSCG